MEYDWNLIRFFSDIKTVMTMRSLYQMVIMVVIVGGNQEQLVVETSSGTVLGERVQSDLGKMVDIWASIPYAEPPVGSLR